MKFPGRKHTVRCASGVSHVTSRGVSRCAPRVYHRPPTTDAPSIATPYQQSRRRIRRTRPAGLLRVDDQPTSAASLPTMSRSVGGHLGVLPRVLAVERLGRHRQLQILDHPRAGDAERLARLVVRPHAAVLAQRRADDRQRLVLQRAVAERPRQPVDGVLQHAGDAAVVLRGDDQRGVGVGGGRRAARRPSSATSSLSMSSL